MQINISVIFDVFIAMQLWRAGIVVNFVLFYLKKK
jgi:hypothetical protein